MPPALAGLHACWSYVPNSKDVDSLSSSTRDRSPDSAECLIDPPASAALLEDAWCKHRKQGRRSGGNRGVRTELISRKAARNSTCGRPGNPAVADLANQVQQQSAATPSQPTDVQRASDSLVAPQRGSKRRMPSLCKQGVTGSSPVDSTPSQTRFAPAWWLYFSVRTAESTAIQTPC